MNTEQNDVSALRQRIEELEAGAAAMREALNKWKTHFQSTSTDKEEEGEDFASAWLSMDQALSTTAGADFLARHKAMEVELAEAKRLIDTCLHTGSLRTDSTRQLYLDVCKFLEVKP